MATNVAPANPIAMNISSTNSWSQPPVAFKSKSGKIIWNRPMSSESPAICSDIGPTSEASMAPIRPMPMPHAIARGSMLAERTVTGVHAMPRMPAGRLGSRRPAVTPRSRLHEQRDPAGHQARPQRAR